MKNELKVYVIIIINKKILLMNNLLIDFLYTFSVYPIM